MNLSINLSFEIFIFISIEAKPAILIKKIIYIIVFSGMIDGFVKIYRVEGIKGFYAGVNATCARLAIGSAAQLTTFST